jgi:ribose/xylose/arabinose/galactoside ABC-type transport system permease subunit
MLTRGSRPQLQTKSGLRHTDELLVTRFAIQPIVATLVLFIAGRGIAQVMTNDDLQIFKPGPSRTLTAMAQSDAAVEREQPS